MKKETPSSFRLSVRPWWILTAAGVVACSATIFGFLGRFSWFLDLFSHFRVQYLFGLSILGVLLLVARRPKTAGTFLAFAGVNLVLVLPMYFGGHSATPEGAHSLRAMLLNVNTRLGDSKRVKQVVREVDPDILVLEEISSQWISDLAWLTHSHPYSVTQPREDNFGIGLFSKLPLTQSKIAYIGSAEVPSILATVETGRTNLRVIATHPLPPAGPAYSQWRNELLDQLPDYTRSSLPLVLLGDLNVTPWSYHFRRLLRRSGLIDSSKGRGIQPTWPSYNPLLRIPIDHCLHSPDVVVLSKEVGADVGSDHFPVIVDLAIRH